jgi:hypothetical protein
MEELGDREAWLAFVSSLPAVDEVQKVHEVHETQQEVPAQPESLELDVNAVLSVLAQYGGTEKVAKVTEVADVLTDLATEVTECDDASFHQGVCGKRGRDEEDDAELALYDTSVSSPASFRPESSMSRGKSPRSFEVRSPKSMKKMKFANEQEEVHVRLYGPNPCRVDQLVRLVKEKKKNAWMKIDELREMCAEAGYAGKSSVFSSVWCIKSSLYGRNKANGSKCEPWGHFFPYFEVRKDRPIDANTRRPSTRQVTWVKLSPEFFDPRNLSTSQ